MGSATDTEVRERRDHTPWTLVDFEKFVNDVALEGSWALPNQPDRPRDGDRVIFVARSRPDVHSRMWYELEWTGSGGKRHRVASQYFQLLMWRAAHVEKTVRDRIAGEEQKQEE